MFTKTSAQYYKVIDIHNRTKNAINSGNNQKKQNYLPIEN